MTYSDLIAETIPTQIEAFLSVDVEDYYHYVPDGEALYERYSLSSNLDANVNRLLELFAERDLKATFFVLSSVASRIAPVILRAVKEGHEIASHGHAHQRITDQNPKEFLDDVRRSKGILEDLIGQRVIGYRAPAFSITDKTLWALDVLAGEGFHYDSSVCPSANFAYGISGAPQRPHRLRNGLVEIPLSVTRFLGYRFVVSGGFYLRAYPFWFLRFLLALRDSSLPLVLYIHPWEWEEPHLNLWDMGITDDHLKERRRLMKWIVSYNRRGAFTKFRRLLETVPETAQLWHICANG